MQFFYAHKINKKVYASEEKKYYDTKLKGEYVSQAKINEPKLINLLQKKI